MVFLPFSYAKKINMKKIQRIQANHKKDSVIKENKIINVFNNLVERFHDTRHDILVVK